MIISDTNILISFILVDRMHWLFETLRVDHLLVPSAVWNELEAGVTQGRLPGDRLTALAANAQIRQVALTSEQRQSVRLPASFGPGESEALILAYHLEGTLLSNDKRVVNFCRESKKSFVSIWAGYCAIYGCAVSPRKTMCDR